MQPGQPGGRRHKKEAIGDRVDLGATWAGHVEAAGQAAVEEVGGSREQEAEARDLALAGQSGDRQERDQEQPDAGEQVGRQAQV